MEANVNTLENKIAAAKKATIVKLQKADAASLARHQDALDSITSGLKKAKAANAKKFGEVFKKMGEDPKLAAHAALEDSRFAKTVKDLKKARAETWADVK